MSTLFMTRHLMISNMTGHIVINSSYKHSTNTNKPPNSTTFSLNIQDEDVEETFQVLSSSVHCVKFAQHTQGSFIKGDGASGEMEVLL